MPTVVRRFNERDSPALWLVYYEAIHQTAAADYTPEQLEAWAPTGFDHARWTQRLQALSPFVAEQDGVMVGYADLQSTGYIDHFFVSPTVARQGVGSLLMQAIHDSASSQELVLLFSDVSITARPFFEHWGFHVDAQTHLSVRGFQLDNFRMRKRLRPSLD